MSEPRRAIFIASSKFEDKKLKNLHCPENDVDGFSDILCARCNFEAENILKLKNEPSHSVLTKVNRLFTQSSKDDLIILYYSGHGKLNSAGKLHLTTSNTEVEILESTSIPAEVLRTYADISPARKVVFILDCCFSGAVGEAFVNNKSSIDDQLNLLSQGRGIYIISSSTSIQVSQEKKSDKYSIFTKYLIQGIGEGSADINGDGLVSIDELYSYVYEQLKKESCQEPMKWNLDVRGKPLIIASTGKVPRQQRRMKIRELLLSFQGKDVLPDPMVSAAMTTISALPSELSDLQKSYDLLLDKWLNKEIRTADLIHEWYTLGIFHHPESNKKSESRASETETAKNPDKDRDTSDEDRGERIESQRFIGSGSHAEKKSESPKIKIENENIPKIANLDENLIKSVDGEEFSELRKILILAVCPPSLPRLRIDEEVRDISQVLRNSTKLRFIVEVRWAVRVGDLQDVMLQFEPQVVHFCGHGGNEGIVLENTDGNAKEISAEALAGLFKLFPNQVDCVIFNACYSESTAQAIVKYTNYVVGMESAIADEDALTFSRGFYKALSHGRTVDSAYLFGCSALQLSGLQHYQSPVLRKAEVVQDIHQSMRRQVLAQWIKTRSKARRILIISVNPKDTHRLRLGEEVRIIYYSLGGAIVGGEFALEQLWGARFGDLREVLLRFNPHIVHFSGIGLGEQGLLFENETGQSACIKAKPLAKLFRLFASRVECVILNASNSDVQARELFKHVTYVIGMEGTPSDSDAIAYAEGFYKALGLGSTIQESHASGLLELESIDSPGYSIPILFSKDSDLSADNLSYSSNGNAERILAIYQSKIELLINKKNNEAYSQAVGLILEVKALMEQVNQHSEFENFLLELCNIHKRKRNFIKLLDQKSIEV